MTIEKLASRAVLVQLHIHLCKGKTRDLRAKRIVQNETGADANFGTVIRNIIPSAYMNPILAAADKLYRRHRELTSPWSNDGARIMSKKMVFKYPELIQAVADEFFHPAVDNLFSDWDKIVDESRRSLKSLFNPADYQNPCALRKKFSFETPIFPVPTKDHFILDWAGDYANSLIADFERNTATLTETAITDPINRTITSLQTLTERLSSYGPGKRLHESILTQTQELLDLLPSLILDNDEEILAATSNAETLLSLTTIETLRDSEYARQETIQTAQQTIQNLENLSGLTTRRTFNNDDNEEVIELSPSDDDDNELLTFAA